jgi:hypothetical protein
VDAEELEDFFTVTLVRNPWDRMVSYYHWLRAQDFDHPAVRLAARLSFADFLAHPQTEASLRAQPYAAHMTDARGRERASLYVRLESFGTDAEPFFDHLGFRLTLPRANASARDPDWRRYYDADSAARVARLCAADIARFGYTF